MSKKKKIDLEASREDREAACEQLLEEAVNKYEDSGEECSEEAGGLEYNAPFFNPMQGNKVWMILALILVVIAVAVLYVYQTGDRKTVLGNQPIPAGQPNMQNGMMMGGAQNVPIGGQMRPLAAAIPGNSGQIVAPVGCPHCSMTGLPVCGSCGTVMRALNDGSGLFACPSCGAVGIPICPHCGGHMNSRAGIGAGQLAQPIGNPALAAAP